MIVAPIPTLKVMPLRRKLVLVLVVAVTVFVAQAVEAGFWKSVWKGTKTVVGAPTKATGWVIGQGVKAAVDPALDGAFDRVRIATDYAASRLEGVLDKEIDQLDQVAIRNINRLDAMLTRRLIDIDGMLDDKILQLESIVTRTLDREAELLDQNIGRLENILSDKVVSLDRLAKQSLGRLEDIKNDAFGHVEAALQDQVPLAASRVAREMVWAATVIIFLIVLVGYTGYRLLRGVSLRMAQVKDQVMHGSIRRTAQRIKENWQSTPRKVFGVALAMIVIAAAIHLVYWGYYTWANYARIRRLEQAAQVFEEASDFSAAAAFRKRVFTLRSGLREQYYVRRDEVIASLVQSHGRTDGSTAAQNFASLITMYSEQAAEDPEIQALQVYLASQYGMIEPARLQNTTTGGQNAGGGSSLQTAVPAHSAEAITKYKNKYMVPTASQKPKLGYLVLVAELRTTLRDTSKNIVTRLDAALDQVTELVDAYPHYAQGLVTRAQLLSMKIERSDYGVKASSTNTEWMDQIESDLRQASCLQPGLVRFLELVTMELSDADMLLMQQLKGSTESWSDAARKEQAAAKLKRFKEELGFVADDVFGWNAKARIEVERCMMRALRRDIGFMQFEAAVTSGREILSSPLTRSNWKQKCDACVVVARYADGIGRPDLADEWVQVARHISSIDASLLPSGTSERDRRRDLDEQLMKELKRIPPSPHELQIRAELEKELDAIGTNAEGLDLVGLFVAL